MTPSLISSRAPVRGARAMRATLLALCAAALLAACGSDSDPPPPIQLKRQPTPLAVTLPAAATTAAAGWAHTCAITAGGALQCWGANGWGQLGNGGASVPCVEGYARCSNGPVAVTAPPAQWSRIAAGLRHSCGLDAAGAAFCWGANYAAQLGSNTSNGSAVPVAVLGGLTYSALAVSLTGDLSCGIAAGNALHCWGRGFLGQFGQGTTTTVSTTPLRVGATQTFTTVALGDLHACALDAAGALFCWGANGHGQVGDGSTTDRLVPTAALGGRSYTQLVTGVAHSCALDAAGVAYCWGSAHQIGRASTTAIERATPTAVAGAQRFVRIAAGAEHTCGLEAGGQLWCWGANDVSQFGDGGTTSSLEPRRIDGVPAFAQLVAGGGHTCGLTAAGAMSCWGATTYGQRGSLP